MANRVGPKGQVVIEKEIRDRLGVQPGWIALQRLVGDRVEITFAPAGHRRSLRGMLAGDTSVRVPPGDAWTDALRQAWNEAVKDKMGHREPEA